MASASREIVAEIPTYITVYKDGSVERPRQTPFVAPSLSHDDVSSEDAVISHNPPISARLYRPKSSGSGSRKLPVLVYFHGGGFFFESAFSGLYHHYFNVFVSQVDAIVVSVEYRLAPEHHLPAAYHDCWAALTWVASCGRGHGHPWLIDHADLRSVSIAGDSAGGNIVHNIALRAGSEPLPGGVTLLSAIYVHPYFYSSEPIGSEPVTLSARQQSLPYLVWNFVYPSAPGGLDNPMVNPLAPGAPSLALLGCSKILICVAGKDSLRDRALWYSAALNKSGWKGELQVFEETDEDHVYHIFHPQSPRANTLTTLMASFLIP